MKILIVEDDSYKYSKVRAFLQDLIAQSEFIHKDSVHGAVLYLRSEKPDLVILDMSLPSHSLVAGQGSPVSMPAGGIEVIMELKLLGKTDIHIVVLTQYPNVEIEDEYYSIPQSQELIRELYGMERIEVIYYDNESADWSVKLRGALLPI
ncbi:MAG: response regulator [Hydrogenophaga sp.]|uniref:response regulator n=1 Tax=Hydrogenophaga sp. TaxID=1904254 RepID=UPI00260C462F|nr:response regulator [Hydrogenophaga sp.]MCV0437435.1 response regulator [Hydrogenophaga sp.]